MCVLKNEYKLKQLQPSSEASEVGGERVCEDKEPSRWSEGTARGNSQGQTMKKQNQSHTENRSQASAGNCGSESGADR